MHLDVLLCDYAQIAGDKLFISGANIDRMVFPAGSPTPYVVNFAAAGLVKVPWAALGTQHTLEFTLLTEDGEIPTLPEGMPVLPEGITGTFTFQANRGPQLANGDSHTVPFVFAFPGLPLMRTGRYALIFTINGAEARRLPFTVQVAQLDVTGFGPADLPNF